MQVVNAVNKPLQIRFALDGSIQLDESLLVLRLVKYHQQFLTLFLWIISKLPQFSHNLDVDDIFLEQEVDDAGRVNALNNRLVYFLEFELQRRVRLYDNEHLLARIAVDSAQNRTGDAGQYQHTLIQIQDPVQYTIRVTSNVAYKSLICCPKRCVRPKFLFKGNTAHNISRTLVKLKNCLNYSALSHSFCSIGS